MAMLYNKNQINALSGREAHYNPFLFNNVGKNLIAMFLQGLFYNILNILVQYKFFIRDKPKDSVVNLNLPKKTDEDEDVHYEHSRLIDEESKNSHKCFRDNKIEEKLTDNELLDKESFIQKINSSNDYVKLINLTKVFRKHQNFKTKKHVAVNNITLGINRGECFGLIGVNGAGLLNFLIIYQLFFIYSFFLIV